MRTHRENDALVLPREAGKGDHPSEHHERRMVEGAS